MRRGLSPTSSQRLAKGDLLIRSVTIVASSLSENAHYIFRSSLIVSSATRSLENPFAIRFAVGDLIAPHLRSNFSPSATHSSVSVTGYLKLFFDRAAFAISRLASRTDFSRFLLPRLTVAFITKPPN